MATTSTYFMLMALCAMLSTGQFTHSDPIAFGNQDLYTLQDECVAALNEQLSLEFYASVVYMNMYGWFSRPSVARLGYAKYFKDQSAEEYGHATKFIDFINKRNGTVKRIVIEDSPKFEWSSPREALNDALKLEKHVLDKINNIHNIADQKCQDPHLLDFLENEFYTEQMESISEITKMIALISTNDISSSGVVEYLEDQKLLKSEEL